MKYFVDTEIFFQGKLQPPRRVPVYDVKVINGKVYCRDKANNQYTLNENEVFEDGLEKDNFIIQHYKGSLWTSEADSFEVYHRKADSTFALLIALPYIAKDNPSAIFDELRANGFDPEKLINS